MSGKGDREPVEVLGKARVGQIKASQIRNAPDHPVQNLYPCAHHPEPYVFWVLNNLGLTEGVLARTSGWMSFAPAMVVRMRIRTFRVVTHIDAFDEACTYRLRLVYKDSQNQHHEQVSAELRAEEVDKFMFEIPLKHVDRRGWFTCALHWELLSPLTDVAEVATAHADGIDQPCHGLLIKGTYLEIKG